MNISKVTKNLSLVLATTAFILISGNYTETAAQNGRDPFRKAPYQKTKKSTSRRVTPTKTNTGTSTTKKGNKKPVKKGPVVVPAPELEARIDYYKRIRQEAVINGQPIPKVTSVLLLKEMELMGVFKTPRGYAAIVQVPDIKLSYTIYPGEKFFDGQLVAVEQNRLIFRKVTKWSNNKFVSSVENKVLGSYTLQQEVQGTTPTSQPYSNSANTKKTEAADKSSSDKKGKEANPGVIVSPLDEMNNQPAETEKDSAKSKSTKGKKGKKRSSKRRKSS